MSLFIDHTLVQAEIDRRYELAGIDRHATHAHDWHRADRPAWPLGLHPLAAWVSRLVGGAVTPARHPSQRDTTVAAGRPRHP